MTTPRSLADIARAEYLARVEAEQIAAEQETAAAKEALRTQVQVAVVAALGRLDGTSPTWDETGLDVRGGSVEQQWLVVSDEDRAGVVEPVRLLVHREDDEWVVRVTAWDGGRWKKGQQVTSLADIGGALPEPG